MTKSGFISVVGRPNVGKSTLVNALVGEKVTITSPRPQTTRNTIRGVATNGEIQLVLVDTPGLHKPRNVLGERLNKLVYGSIAEADAVLFLLDAGQPIGPGDRLIAERLGKSGAPVIVAVNKTDQVSSKDVLGQLARAGEWDFAAYVPISALKGVGLEPLRTELEGLMPEGPFFFPPHMHSDQPDQLLAGELVREKYLSRLREELPHSLAVVVGDIEERDNGVLYIPATVYIERQSQKGMVIGKGGGLIKTVGAEARTELERLFGVPVFLDLRVKVEKDWQRKDDSLNRMGF
ncbi:MAG: GTPase Era [Actinomycetia bacterium]|nr:GTPase Era [Actinomycetes bacterium]